MNTQPDYWGGANKVSLRQAQRNFIRFGASEKEFVNDVRRGEAEKDSEWRPVWEIEQPLDPTTLKEIVINGNIIHHQSRKSIEIDHFMDEFSRFLEQRGWAFGGEMKQRNTEIKVSLKEKD